MGKGGWWPLEVPYLSDPSFLWALKTNVCPLKRGTLFLCFKIPVISIVVLTEAMAVCVLCLSVQELLGGSAASMAPTPSFTAALCQWFAFLPRVKFQDLICDIKT